MSRGLSQLCNKADRIEAEIVGAETLWHNACRVVEPRVANEGFASFHPNQNVWTSLQPTAAFLERRIMKKLNKVAFSSRPPPSLRLQSRVRPERRQLGAQHRHRLEERHERTVLARCQLDAATAAEECDGAPGGPARPRPPCRPAPRPGARPAAPALPKPPWCPAAPTSEGHLRRRRLLRHQQGPVLKAEGKAKLDDLTRPDGHQPRSHHRRQPTDSDGSDAYNQKLSVRRAEAVKDYLVTQGRREEPRLHRRQGREAAVADNKTKEGKAKNRRVEIEVVGTHQEVIPDPLLPVRTPAFLGALCPADGPSLRCAP